MDQAYLDANPDLLEKIRAINREQLREFKAKHGLTPRNKTSDKSSDSAPPSSDPNKAPNP